MKINRSLVLSLGAVAALVQPLAALAADPADFERRVEERLDKLEKGAATKTSNLSEKLSFNALIEMEAGIVDTFEDSTVSDINVATVEIGIGAEINENVSAELVFLYEEDETPFDVDVAVLNFDELLGPVDLVLGKQYLPFGQFETALINDTLVLELAEANKTAAVFEFANDSGLTANAFIFDGDSDREQNVENYGFGVGYGQDSFSAGVQFISSIAESDAISDLGLIQEGGEAVNIYGQLDLDAVVLIGEYLTTFSDMEVVGGSVEPEALQLEADFPATINGREYVFGVAYQMTDDAALIELPEQRLSFGGSTKLDDNLSLAVEFFHDEDYDRNDGGTGDSGQGLVAQIAAEF